MTKLNTLKPNTLTLEMALMGLAISIDLRKMWASKWHTRRDKRPGFLNGAGFKPRG